MEQKDNIIVDKTLKFALNIIKYCELLESKRKYVVANQLLKSGTSIGANIREAQNAESKNDFIHKFKITAKEVDETEYWLELCHLSNNYPSISSLKSELIEITKIVNKIISTSKRNTELTHFQIDTFSNYLNEYISKKHIKIIRKSTGGTKCFF